MRHGLKDTINNIQRKKKQLQLPTIKEHTETENSLEQKNDDLCTKFEKDASKIVDMKSKKKIK